MIIVYNSEGEDITNEIIGWEIFRIILNFLKILQS